jgi:hypothetical protein
VVLRREAPDVRPERLRRVVWLGKWAGRWVVSVEWAGG